MKLNGKHVTKVFHKGASTDRGSSQQGGTGLPGQKAPPIPGLFSQCEQHTEQPGRTVGYHQHKGLKSVYNNCCNQATNMLKLNHTEMVE